MIVLHAFYLIQNTLITEDIAYAPGRSLSVVKVPRNLKTTALYSTLCAQRTDAFYLFDLDWLLESHELWKKNMANIRPYYGERGWHACCVCRACIACYI